jgi:hypothetical protein
VTRTTVVELGNHKNFRAARNVEMHLQESEDSTNTMLKRRFAQKAWKAIPQ